MNSHEELDEERNNEEQKVYSFVQSQRVVIFEDLLQFHFHSYNRLTLDKYLVETITFKIIDNPIPIRVYTPKKCFILQNIIGNFTLYKCQTKL